MFRGFYAWAKPIFTSLGILWSNAKIDMKETLGPLIWGPPPDEFPAREFGWRYDSSPQNKSHPMCLLAVVPRSEVFEMFREFLDLLGPTVEAQVEINEGHRLLLFVRERIDRVIAEHILVEHENLIVQNGSFSLALIDCVQRAELRINEEKVILFKGTNITNGVNILRARNVDHQPLLECRFDIAPPAEVIAEEPWRELVLELGAESFEEELLF